MMDAATMTAALGFLTMISGKALETWGPFAFVLIVPGVMAGLTIFGQRRQMARKDEEIASLRKEKDELQAKRLEDAQATMRLAKSGTETMAARTEGDQAFRDLVTRMVDEMRDLREEVRTRPRRPSR